MKTVGSSKRASHIVVAYYDSGNGFMQIGQRKDCIQVEANDIPRLLEAIAKEAGLEIIVVDRAGDKEVDKILDELKQKSKVDPKLLDEPADI